MALSRAVIIHERALSLQVRRGATDPRSYAIPSSSTRAKAVPPPPSRTPSQTARVPCVIVEDVSGLYAPTVQSLGVDADGLPATPVCSVEIKDMLSPFMPLKVSQKRSKRSSLAKQAPAPTAPTTSTIDGRPLRRDDATSHGFRSGDAAAAAVGEIVSAEPVDKPVKPPTKKSRRTDGGKPVPGYCEFCEVSFEDMKDHAVSLRHIQLQSSPAAWRALDDFVKACGVKSATTTQL